MKRSDQISNLPTPSVGGLSVYLAQIKKFPCWMPKKNICWQKLEGKW